MFLLLSIHMNRKEGPLGPCENFSHHLAVIQYIPSWRTFYEMHIYCHCFQKFINTMCNRGNNKYSRSVLNIEMEEQGSFFTLNSSYPNDAWERSIQNYHIFYLSWKDIAPSKYFPEFGHSGGQSWISIFHLGLSKTWSLSSFKLKGDSTFKPSFPLKFVHTRVKAKTGCKCRVLFKDPDRALLYPALGVPCGKVCCQPQASVLTSLPTLQTAGCPQLVGVTPSPALCHNSVRNSSQVTNRSRGRKHICN